ncbi:lysophospholipid acyltransferase family protein [Granulosicoccus sp. 3-233]|uniref:lysophospholipid acyltransferase family protein n=1 Tax=Granulosicoccus sp. 3-233 TaxID=3417969 RepID=UPI003D330D4D
MRPVLAWLSASAIVVFARLITAVHARWQGCEPRARQRIYYANHCSHGDFVLLWTVLPASLRQLTRPVAGADYWSGSALKRFIGRDVFRSVLIERNPAHREQDPVTQMTQALDAGDSLILFPEGTRNTGNTRLLPFRSGLYHLSESRPEVELVPVWISNLNRVLPKGEVIPVPLICSVTFGVPLARIPEEGKAAFLARAEQSLLALAMMEAGIDNENQS